MTKELIERLQEPTGADLSGEFVVVAANDWDRVVKEREEAADALEQMQAQLEKDVNLSLDRLRRIEELEAEVAYYKRVKSAAIEQYEAEEAENDRLRADNERLRGAAFHIQFSHEAVNAFWRVWREFGELHKHGVYESTWMAFKAAMEAGGKDQRAAVQESDDGTSSSD